MNVFIARDGETIGEYPREALEEMARNGELELDDHYWQDGMEEWLPLPELLGPEAFEPPPPPPPPPNYRLIFGLGAAALGLILLIGFLVIRPDRAKQISNSRPLPDPATALQIRDKAAADLRARIERLPARATPPMNTFYYDVRVNMKETFNPNTPWIATLHGFENTMEGTTDVTLRRTDFFLDTDYENGEWIFKHYRATITNLKEGNSVQMEQTGGDPTPPSVVGMLGLKGSDARAPDSISLKIP